MPTYPGDIQDKLDALQALTGAERKPAELVAIYWPSPTGTTIYASAMYTELPWWPDLADAIESYFGDPISITLTLIPDSTPFIDLPRAASISDDSINLTFDDNDDVFSGLLMDYGEGIRTEVFCYWPAVDLLLSMWRGMLHQAKEMNRDQVKVTATSGWRAANMLVPKRPFATSCPFIFGAYFATQDEIDAHTGCPYNAHIGGSIGVPGFTDCPRRLKSDCTERLVVETFWPGFETREDPIPNNQTKGPNLLAKSIGNESALSDPIRVIYGERYVKALYLLAFRNETDTNHPEDGFGAALFAVSEGTNLAMWEFRINGQIVGTEHFQLRLGALGQPVTDWSPDVNSYSGTAHGYGRIQGRFDDATASDYSGAIRVLGQVEVRVYSDVDTYAESYTTNRAWCLLDVLAHLRFGYGQDYPRYNIDSFIDAAAWCDELVTLTDANGNTFSGVRSTFNAEVNPRAIQQQVKDICTAGRLGIPFEFEGKDVLVPLRAEDVDDASIPTFTDEGASRNIVYDGARSSLSWSVISDETMVNQWTVNFDDNANGGVDTQYIFGDQAQQLRAGRAWGDRSKRVVNKSQAGYGITSAQEAARFGNALLYLGPLDSGGILNPFSVKFTTWYSEAFNVQNYRLIKVVNAKLQSRMTAYFAARGLEPYPGADFTCFRVMKYTRKGDLRVEIEAQQYATLEEAPAECADITYVAGSIDDDFQNISVPTGVVDGDFMIAFVHRYLADVGEAGPGTDGWTPLPHNPVHGGSHGDAPTAWAFYRFADSEPASYNFAGDDDLEFFITIEAYRGVDPSNPIADSATDQAATNPDPIDLASVTTTHENSRLVGFVVAQTFLPVSPVGFTTRHENLDDTRTLDKVQAAIGATGALPFDWSAQPNQYKLSYHVALSPDCGGMGGATFSAPRDLTAVVTASTGLVHFHWSPPASHPELVTGYTLYESDGTTVVMPTDLTYDFEVTLAPGTYTYRLNATDGATVSVFASVTFTVDAPPVTGTDLYVVDDLTLENVMDDLTIEQVTV